MKRYTLEEVENRLFEKHGGKIVLLEYSNMERQGKFKCLICTTEWQTTPNSVITNGTGCPVCGQESRYLNRRFSIKYVREYIESNNCKLLSEKYKNAKEKLIIQFECGHIGNKITFEAFKLGQRCRICSYKTIIEANKISEKRILEMMNENSFIYTGFPNGYKNGESYITFICQYGHENKRKFSGYLQTRTCIKCTNIKMSISQIGTKNHAWRGGLRLVRKMIKDKIKEWKQQSMRICNYSCIFSGERFDDIHHLQSMNLILKESIRELGFPTHELSWEYTDDEMFQLINKVREIHDRYPLGVCLQRKYHKAFHNIYGYGDTTPSDFYEFQQRISTGEIQI